AGGAATGSAGFGSVGGTPFLSSVWLTVPGLTGFGFAGRTPLSWSPPVTGVTTPGSGLGGPAVSGRLAGRRAATRPATRAPAAARARGAARGAAAAGGGVFAGRAVLLFLRFGRSRSRSRPARSCSSCWATTIDRPPKALACRTEFAGGSVAAAGRGGGGAAAG